MNIELKGILEASYFPIQNNLKKVLIATYSASALKSISNAISGKNDIELKNAQLLGPNLSLIWVPGHMDFTKNELADRAADHATEIITYENKLPLMDIIRAGTYSLRNKWERERIHRSKLNRLRIGHTALTHRFLLSK